MQSIARRLERAPDEELREALRQIDAIAALRLMDRVRQ
jgi:2-oxo-4-hydroxy-4-carboxy--5-ureidoimidazoline (OHCU) decarboxylase